MSDPIQRIEDALSKLGAEHEPPPGWEARVLAATGARDRRRWNWWWLVAPSAVVALAVVAFALWPLRGSDSVAVAYTVEQRSAMRGSDVHTGDVVHVALTSSARHRALRIYRNDTLVIECPGAPECTGDGVTLTIGLLGTYRIIALGSHDELARSTRDLDLDQAAAIKADASHDEKLIEVR